MPSTRQLRGGDYVLRVEDEDLDILKQGVQKLEDDVPDFTQVDPQFRETIEHTYSIWRARVEQLDDMLAHAEHTQNANNGDSEE